MDRDVAREEWDSTQTAGNRYADRKVSRKNTGRKPRLALPEAVVGPAPRPMSTASPPFRCRLGRTVAQGTRPVAEPGRSGRCAAVPGDREGAGLARRQEMMRGTAFGSGAWRGLVSGASGPYSVCVTTAAGVSGGVDNNPIRRDSVMRSAAFAATAAVVLAASAVQAQTPLKIGDPAPPLSVSRWVKGTPNKLTPGKVHVVEFWATWCGPCKATIPHLTELSKKFQGQADFTGVSIWEANGGNADPVAIGKKVDAFVAEMGAKMGYSVATDDKLTGGTMATKWMAAAGENGIPSAFIVDQKGKVAWIGHPMQMDEPLAKICAGKWDTAAYAKEAAVRKAAELRMQAFSRDLQQLLIAGKTADAMALVDKDTAGDSAEAGAMRTQVAGMLNSIAWTVSDPKRNLPPQFAPLKKAAVEMARKAADLSGGTDPQILDTLAFALSQSGNVKEALSVQEKAVGLLPKDAPAQLVNELKARLAEYQAKAK